MVRPGNKRLMEANYVKVQPNKTGTSFMQGQSVNYRKGTSCLVDGTCNQDGILLKKGVHFNSAADTPYNNLANSNSFTPEYTEAQKKADRECECAKRKVWPTDSNGNIIPKSWNFSWQ